VARIALSVPTFPGDKRTTAFASSTDAIGFANDAADADSTFVS
jgi:hypothetical protein